MSTIEVSSALLFAGPLVVSSLSLATLHWFPWHGGAESLERTTAYTLGTLVTVGVPGAAMLLAAALALPQGEIFWTLVLWANALVSGITVKACYWVDSKRALTLEDAANERR